MKVLITFILFLFMDVISHAQQEPVYSEYIFNRILINPAYAGAQAQLNTIFTHRNHLQGIKGAPVVNSFSIHGPLFQFHIALGLKAVQERFGITEQSTYTGIYSYQLKIPDGKISGAIEGGILQQKINWQELMQTGIADAALPQNTISTTQPVINFGGYVTYKNFYSGLSAYHFLNTVFERKKNTKSIQKIRQYNFMAGMENTREKFLNIDPSFLIKYMEGKSFQWDASLVLFLKNMLGIGVSFRSNGTVSGIFKLYIRDLAKIGYAYDYSYNDLSLYNNGVNELIINISIPIKDPEKNQTMDPRFYTK